MIQLLINYDAYCLQDMTVEPVIISFSKNGEDLGTCFSVEKSELNGAALFPHILSKNTEVTMNFGQDLPQFPVSEGYIFIEHIPEEERTRGSLPPKEKEDCQV